MRERRRRAARWAFVGLIGHWLLLVLVPWHQWQELRLSSLGLVIPFYYPLVAGSALALVLLCALARPPSFRRGLPWAMLIGATLPGILLCGDAAWGLRCLASFLVRGFLPGFLLAWLLSAAEAGVARKTSRVLCATAGALAIIGLVEIFSRRYFLMDVLDLSCIRSSADGGGEPANALYRPSLLAGRLHYSVSGLPVGTVGNRLVFGSCLVAFMPLSLWGLRHDQPKLLHGSALFALLACLLFTPARSAWLGTLAALVLYLGPSGLWRRHGRLLLACTAAAVLSLLTVRATRPDVVEEMAQKTVGFRLAEPSASMRLGSYALASRLEGRAVCGVGLGRAPEALQRADEAPLVAVDNQFLKWFLETGLVGTVALAGFLGLLAVTLYRGFRRATEPAVGEARLAVLSATTGMTVTFVFFDGFGWAATQATFWSLVGAGWALVRDRDPATVPWSPGASPTGRCGSGASASNR